VIVTRRGEVLELAVLGLLQESPMHGYELRKRVNAVLGMFRALSYGTLYPCLKSLLARGWIQEAGAGTGVSPRTGRSGKRGRIVYELTAEGKERFQAMVSHPGPAAWEDEQFDVHFAFFARTDTATRLQILEGRRTRMQERLEHARQSMARTRERLDAYTLELQRHGLESVEREVRWLTELIDTERGSRMTHPPTDVTDHPGPDRTARLGHRPPGSAREPRGATRNAPTHSTKKLRSDP
jgi:DNA-binding PadR family transcriptional regulator